MLLPLQGASLRILITQSDALGYGLIAPSGRVSCLPTQLLISRVELGRDYVLFLSVATYLGVYLIPCGRQERAVGTQVESEITRRGGGDAIVVGLCRREVEVEPRRTAEVGEEVVVGATVALAYGRRVVEGGFSAERSERLARWLYGGVWEDES